MCLWWCGWCGQNEKKEELFMFGEIMRNNSAFPPYWSTRFVCPPHPLGRKKRGERRGKKEVKYRPRHSLCGAEGEHHRTPTRMMILTMTRTGEWEEGVWGRAVAVVAADLHPRAPGYGARQECVDKCLNNDVVLFSLSGL